MVIGRLDRAYNRLAATRARQTVEDWYRDRSLGLNVSIDEDTHMEQTQWGLRE